MIISGATQHIHAQSQYHSVLRWIVLYFEVAYCCNDTVNGSALYTKFQINQLTSSVGDTRFTDPAEIGSHKCILRAVESVQPQIFIW